MDFRRFYEDHVRFVWRALARLGVDESDLPDAAQEVFVVVHRKLSEFEGRSKVTTWLFSICMRVASDRRRRAHVRFEIPHHDPSGSPLEGDAGPFTHAHAKELLAVILDGMPDEQRVVFALFELEGLSGEEIAELLDVPEGTVRSRLRLARNAFQQAVSRLEARERGRAGIPLRARLA
jgi:RNA polymerase sigma-70 factor (ECF subfamily)